MKRTKALTTISLFLIPLIIGVVFVDLSGTFSYSDLPFAIAFLLYITFVFLQRAKSRTAFIMSLFFLAWMGLSYVPTGASVLTERIGEWFYLFFVFGLIQYNKEVWHIPTP